MPKNSHASIEEALTRGVEELIGKDELASWLSSGKPLRIKLGIDPTSPNIHIGRSIPLLKLRDFQELGHQVVLIIGDFTGTIGDTSDKTAERPMLDQEAVETNMKSYVAQASKILDISKCEIHYNSEWFNTMGYREICKQADLFSVNDFSARDTIARRLKTGKRVSLREMLYPLMQGYDSVAIRADVELGGMDQRFNILAGRTMQKQYGQRPQAVMLNPLVEGLDGRKMSSSWGNTINLMDSPRDMFGKLMSLNDEFIIKYFTLLTRVEDTVIDGYKTQLDNNVNPRDIKLKLASAIVAQYHSEAAAKQEEDYFINTFTKKELPAELRVVTPNSYDLTSVLLAADLASSKSEARRVIEQGGVKVDQTIVKDTAFDVPKGAVVQKGKVHFVRIG